MNREAVEDGKDMLAGRNLLMPLKSLVNHHSYATERRLAVDRNLTRSVITRKHGTITAIVEDLI